MDIDEAYRLLGLSSDANEQQRHEAYEAQQQALREKIAKAPTPGLRVKYESGLETLQQAIEVVEESLDDSALPVLQPQLTEGKTEAKGLPPEMIASAAASAPAPNTVQAPGSKGYTKEIIIAVILVAACVAGGYFYWQHTEDLRIKEEQRIENERLAAEKKAAEEKAAAEKAGAERLAVLDEKEQLRKELVVRHFKLEESLRELESIKDAENDKVRAFRQEIKDSKSAKLKWKLRNMEAHAKWLDDYVANHKARATLREAKMLEKVDLKAMELQLTEAEYEIKGSFLLYLEYDHEQNYTGSQRPVVFFD